MARMRSLSHFFIKKRAAGAQVCRKKNRCLAMRFERVARCGVNGVSATFRMV
ncbi:hypothetical protein BSLA_03f0174 [Burkholderia stabilis]|nr:hypothetical protein BSLA_03f0174 [Burkholderia stabilis]